MMYNLEPAESRTYKKENSCIFKKNNDEFGGLSNMATGFGIKINNIEIKTSEALYQACRFPHLPDLQRKIFEQKSPMNVKMISNANKGKSREDWEEIRVKIMKWCIKIKLAQNFISFGSVLNETGLKNIVENSSKDNFWGAIPDKEGNNFTGKNALGRLLMDLRQSYYSEERYSLIIVNPPKVENFLIINEKVNIIDERENYINSLFQYWQNMSKKNLNKQVSLFSNDNTFG